MSEQTSRKRMRRDNPFGVIALCVLVFAALVGLRWMVVQPFRAPSGSMQPTIQIGDYFIVTKWSYGWSRYSFGEISSLLPQRTETRGCRGVSRPVRP